MPQFQQYAKKDVNKFPKITNKENKFKYIQINLQPPQLNPLSYITYMYLF
jgi:hypothetical protein